jgi:BirA family biotin operon repressor/biotin-[acetyl-CoA-carboxylase] ligase
MLSATIALSCRELLNQFTGGDIFVKWPNDIYWRDRKAGGILIENQLSGSELRFSIAGIGLNINQVNFPAEAAKAVSLRQITGRQFDTENLAHELCRIVSRRLQSLQEDQIVSEYNEHLLFKDQQVKLRTGNVTFETYIIGVNREGELLTKDVVDRSFREVVWILTS